MPTTPSKSGLLPRCVLGELTPNTKLSPKKLGKVPGIEWTNVKRTPHKTLTGINEFTESSVPAIESVLSPRLRGKKRRFDEFDEASKAKGQGESKRGGQHLSPEINSVTAESEHGIGPRVDASDTPPNLQDTAANPEAEVPPFASQASFTSLIDYDPADAPVTNAAAASTPPTGSGDANTVDVRSQAETLRLRLRVAMFKVRTNQTHLPMSQLQITPRHLNASTPAVTKTRPRSASITPLRNFGPLHTSPLPDRVLSPTKSSSPEAYRPSSRPAPKLLPAPVLRPTAYSARFVYASSTTLGTPYVPSSPPEPDQQGTQTSSSDVITYVQTPAGPARANNIVELSSPPDSAEQEEGKTRHDDARLSSSVVKGRAAARGLVELMHAT